MERPAIRNYQSIDVLNVLLDYSRRPVFNICNYVIKDQQSVEDAHTFARIGQQHRFLTIVSSIDISSTLHIRYKNRCKDKDARNIFEEIKNDFRNLQTLIIDVDKKASDALGVSTVCSAL